MTFRKSTLKRRSEVTRVAGGDAAQDSPMSIRVGKEFRAFRLPNLPDDRGDLDVDVLEECEEHKLPAQVPDIRNNL